MDEAMDNLIGKSVGRTLSNRVVSSTALSDWAATFCGLLILSSDGLCHESSGADTKCLDDGH